MITLAFFALTAVVAGLVLAAAADLVELPFAALRPEAEESAPELELAQMPELQVPTFTPSPVSPASASTPLPTDDLSAPVVRMPAESAPVANVQAGDPPPTEPPPDEPPVEQEPQTEPAQVVIPSGPVPQQVVIQFDPASTAAERIAYVESIGGTVSKDIEALDTAVVNVPASYSAAALPESPVVVTSEPDYYVTALAGPLDDPLYPDQWALPVIGAPEAWDSLPADLPPMTVAVIDSGICAEHPDLVGHVASGWDFVESDEVAQDAFGHGCAVASVLAASHNNTLGIAGVAPHVQIMPLRVLDDRGLGAYSHVAAAIIYAADHGTTIVNLSLGGSFPSVLLENAINYAVSRGVTVVAAAGNTGMEGVLYPAAYENAIAVGSVDPSLERSSFSTYGPEIDLLAPGRDILVTTGSGGYSMVSGTSFAAPHVAGVAALELALGSELVIDGGVVRVHGLASVPVQTPEATEEATPEEPPVETVRYFVLQDVPVPVILRPGTDYEIVTPPGHGTLLGELPSITYMPESGYLGEDFFVYSVVDDEQVITVEVTLEVVQPDFGKLQADVLEVVSEEAEVGVIITLHDPVSIQADLDVRAAAVAEAQLSVLGELPATDFELYRRYSHVPALAGTVTASGLAILQANPLVASVELDRTISIDLGQSVSLIDADDVHNSYGLTDVGIRVAVLDTGVDTNHPDLQDDIVAQHCFNSGDCPPSRTNESSSAEDEQGHGTHVAGIISSSGAVSSAGFAPDAEIIGVRVLNSSGNGTISDMIAGLNWLIANHATLGTDVVNMSLGDSSQHNTACDAVNVSSANAVNQLDALGVVVIAASGNNAYNAGISSPACLTKVLSVGASYDSNVGGISWSACSDASSSATTVTCFTNAGTLLDVIAPGAIITSSGMGGGTAQMGGTSQASPTVAGVAALLKQADSALTTAQVRTLLQSTGSPIHKIGSATNFPLINALAAMESLAGTYPAVALNLGLHQQTSANINYVGIWTQVNNASASGGSWRYSSTPGASALFKVNGYGFTLYRLLNYNRTTMEVCIDGACQTINNYSPSLLFQQKYTFSNLGPGVHQVRIRNTGTIIDLDAIEVLAAPTPLGTGFHQQSHQSIGYVGAWNTGTNSAASGGSFAFTNDPNARAIFQIDGEGLAIYRVTGANRGSMQVCIDGTCQTVNNYSTTTFWKQPVVFDDLGSGVHDVEIRNQSAAYMDLDVVEVKAARSALPLGTHQQTHTGLWYSGGWTTGTNASASGGSFLFSNNPSAVVSFEITGEGLILYRTTNTNRGLMEVCIHSTCQTINNYSPTVQWQQPVAFRNLGSGTHLVQIRNKSNAYIDLDAVQVVGPLAVLPVGTYQETHTEIAFNGVWTTGTNSNALSGAFKHTNDASASYSFRINGDGFILYRVKSYNRGPMQVCIDSDPCQTVNNYNSTMLWKQPAAFYGLGSGTHNVTVRNTTGVYLDLDAIEVVPAPVPLGAGLHQQNNTNVRYTGAWQTGTNPSANGGSFTYSSDPGARIEFQFTGSSLSLYRTMNSSRGLMKVCVDGWNCRVAPSYNGTTLWQQQIKFTDLLNTTHSVVITRLSGSYIDLDAVQVGSVTPTVLGAGVYQENHTALDYTGNWSNGTNSNASGGTFMFTNDASAVIAFEINVPADGWELAVYRVTGSNRGTMDVCVDSTCETVSNVTSTTRWQQESIFTNIPAGTHDVVIYNNSAAYLDLDKIELRDATDAGKVLRLVNEQRCAVGTPPLSLNAALTSAAQRHSNDM
ncbi:MAG: S8 family serine peptidase, partial [Chloroflexi bacterium]|nr:S8 family serine peptidase [Chloroflexota bacterium]